MKKSDFPIFKNNPGLVYLDSAASSQKPQIVIDTIKDYYEKLNANVHRGIYDLSEKATELYELSREKVAKFINAKSANEIVFTRNTTESINYVARAWAEENIKQGDEILITEMEHHSNLVPWQQLANKKNLQMNYMNVVDFKIDLEAAKKQIRELKPAIVAITQASNTLGTVTPIKEITKVAHENGALVLVDAAQSVPHIKVDVQKLGVDFLAFSGHKMLGPMGIGVLYVKEEVLENMVPFMTGGGMIEKVTRFATEFAPLPERTDAGTPNVAGAIGLAAAIDYLEKIGMDKVEEYEKELTKYAIKKLEELEEVQIIGPKTKRLGVISFAIDGVHPHDLASMLNEDKIAIRAGHHCNQVLMKEVLKVPATARASFYVYNEKRDVDKLIKGVKKVITTFNG